MSRQGIWTAAGLVVALGVSLLLPRVKAEEPRPVYTRWETFTTENGLPDNKVFAVLVDGPRVWVGTDNGLGLYENGTWKVFRPADGLAHRAVLSLAVDPKTGDLWIGTMGGLNRLSAGRFDTFTQLNSGLVNDIVYGVAVQDHFVWAATAAGVSRLDTRSGDWSIYNEKNTMMHEIWCYGLAVGDGKVYVAVWGSGLLEYNVAGDYWKDYRDPDGEMELVLFRDQGLIHDITSSVSAGEHIVWVATYFGLSSYDGRNWHGYMDHDSGLASNFVIFVKAQGDAVWVCTDKGLNYFDGKQWITYRRNSDGPGGEIKVTEGTQVLSTQATAASIAHNFVLGIDLQGNDIWVATAKGLSHGFAP
jgi:ligand-binding sensor domain-containing protein